MAQLKRSEIITLAVKWAGRKAQALDLDDEFDFVTRDMSLRYPLLRTSDTGSLTADQNYISTPSDYRSQDLFITSGGYPSGFKVDTDWLPFLESSAEFNELDATMYGTPVLYMVQADLATKKIYFYPYLETDTPAYVFLYYKIHAKATDDNTVHDYGEFWDNVVANGVAMRAGNMMKEDKIEAKFEARYLNGLQDMNALVNARPYLKNIYHDF